MPADLERRLIAASCVLLGVYNIALSMLRAPLSGIGQFRHVVPVDAVNGSRFVLLLVGIVLLETGPGLWHGKRFAWMVAIAGAVISALAHPLMHIDVWGTSASLLLAGALLGGRAQFPARSDPPTALRGAVLSFIGIGSVFAYSVLGLYFLDREFKQPVSFADALKDSVQMLFIAPATSVEPRTAHGTWFVDSVRVGFAFVLLLSVPQLLRPVVNRTYVRPVERARVRALLTRYADSSIAHFALLPDKAYFFSDSGEAVIAFKVVRGSAVVMGDPIGDEREFAGLVAAFQRQCELNGWAYAFHQARPRYVDLYRQRGLKALKIGEEGVVPLETFTLAGQAMKHLRSTMSRLEREGYRPELLYPPHEPALLDHLRAVSDEWLAQGERRERTFTLGQFDEALLQECEIIVARSPDGMIGGFANIIPSYHLQQGNFDMLRYRATPKGMSDFLYVSLICHFRQQGFAGMNLGLAPFSGLDVNGLAPAERAMRLLYERGDFLFRYKGLREFKEKFGPLWEARYLVYRSDLELPGIALAVARAGEL